MSLLMVRSPRIWSHAIFPPYSTYYSWLQFVSSHWAYVEITNVDFELAWPLRLCFIVFVCLIDANNLLEFIELPYAV
jgi:hypothetical protein